MRRRRALAAAVVLTSTAALAFNTIDYNGAPATWKDARCTVYHDPSWSAYPNYVNELRAAMSPWGAVQGSNFRFTHGGASPSTNLFDTSNGNSDVYFDDLSANAYAITWIMQSGPNLFDRDVVFNTDWTWSPGGGSVDFRSVAIHELGHVLGLDHESTTPSVMKPYYDGFTLEHSLYFDDEEGCRFLYPEPPPPPPPPSDADLVLDKVTISPDDATSGDTIDVAYTMRNAGTDPTGSFAATVYLLEDASVSPDDRFLRARLHGSLAPGETRDVSVSVPLPDVLESRTYRIGMILDAQQATGDRDRSNNDGVAATVLRGGGHALDVGPGYRVTGTLLPFGRESFRLDLTRGTRLKLKSSMEGGTLELIVEHEEGGQPLVQRRRYRRSNAKLRVPEDGSYLVHIDSQNATVAEYELRVGARTIRLGGDVALSHANHIRVPGYLGNYVDASVRAKGDVHPTLEWAGMQAAVHSNKKGTRVKLRKELVRETGPLVLVLSQGNGPAGDARWRIRMKVPKKGPYIRR